MDHDLGWDEAFWRDRAEEMRLLAAQMQSPEAQSIFLEMAAVYLRRAQRAVSKAADRKKELDRVER